ncbi:Cupin 2 conserved barrel domain protein [Gemmatirosa kalamazoonensis]|uniref:Cupin 2 conserved barrel domain protein n=1 Tax=Gemmatirosa kalamazoonensis TaxID=861299 RepID=W0RE84_9BACT|nr:cupin domain-containing protein [Gemmatirosa kalamazoonensis]AHG88732.1 Cupin 2 conserved barrel domain protein [Gemmatirosa kalamazoonensis]
MTRTTETGAFVRSAETAWQQMAPGVQRQILGYGPDLMMVRVEFEAGAIGAVHHHPHRQVTYVAAGAFEVTVGDESETLGAGDCFFARADVPHGVRALEAGTLVDVFTPARADFLA